MPPQTAVLAPIKRRRRKSNLVPVDTNLLTGYTRVSTREQAESKAGLEHQDMVIAANAAMTGRTILNSYSDPGKSAKDLDREGLQEALAEVRAGLSGGIIVSKLDRLSRSVSDFAALMAEAERDGWNIVALDLGIDLKTSSGRLVARIMATIAEWEREVIGERTKDGLAAKQAAGVRLGRPRETSDEILAVVLDAYTESGSYSGVARKLNEAGVPTTQGGTRWWPMTVSNMVNSQDGLSYSAAKLEELAA